MATYTQLTTQQINHLASLYNLNLESYSAMEGGAANSSYLLQTDQGKFVLTVYQDYPAEHVSHMAQTLWLLAENNFPAMVVMPTSDGQAAAMHEGKPVLVKEYIDGQVIQNMDAEMLAQVGAALARLHQIPAPDYLSNQHPYGIETFSTFIGLDIDDEFDAWLSDRIEYLQENTPENLPRAIIHGDLFNDNLLFQDGKLRAIIDFEEVCNYYKVFDLGMTLLGICGLDGNLDMEKAQALLAGYVDAGKLDEIERNSLQIMVETAATATACWRFWKYNIHDPTPERAQLHWDMAKFAEHVRAIDKNVFMDKVFGD